jgi:hypothetical protein
MISLYFFHFISFYFKKALWNQIGFSKYVCVRVLKPPLHFFLYVSETILFRKNAVQADCNAACTDVFLSH